MTPKNKPIFTGNIKLNKKMTDEFDKLFAATEAREERREPKLKRMNDDTP
jgi:hypothetical protein